MNRKKRNFKHSLFVVLACCGTLNVLTPATNTVFAIKTVTPATVAGSLVNGREAGSNQRFSLPTEEAICALQGETFTIKPANPSGELTAVVITNGTPKEARTEFSQWAYDVFVKGFSPVVQKVQQRVLEPAAAVAAPAAAAAPGAAPAVAAQQQNVTTETVEEEDPTVLQFNLQKVENSLPWRRLINAIKRGETGIVVLTGTTRGLDRNQKVYLTFVLGSDAAVGTNSDTTSVPAKETAETERELPLPREEVETSIRTAINLCAAKGDPIPERDIRRTGLLVPGGVFGTLAVFPGAKLDLGLRDKSQQPVLFWRFRGDKITTPQSLNLGVATSEQNTEVQAIKQTFTARFGSALAAKTHVVLLRQNGALGCLATICVRLSLPEGDQPCLYAVLGDASSPAYVKIDTPVLYSDRTGFVSITTAWGGPLLVCEEPLPNT